MATSQVDVKSCDLCGAYRLVSWQCTQCEEILCEGCKNIHLKGKATRNHEIKETRSNEEAFDASLVKSFKLTNSQGSSNSDIVSITPISSKCAWFCMKNDKYIKLYYSDGSSKEQIQFSNYGSCTAVADNGSVLASVPGSFQIVAVNHSSNIQTMIHFQNLKPLGICSTMTGHVIVSVVDKHDFETNEESVRMLYKLNLRFNVIEVFGHKPNKNLFTIPCKVQENSNGDIIIIDNTGENTASVVILDKDGVFRFRYKGQECTETKETMDTVTKPFNASDLTIDRSLGRILIAEKEKKQIHIIDQNGKFIQYLRTNITIEEEPTSIALFDRVLWIGYGDGQVKTFKYLL